MKILQIVQKPERRGAEIFAYQLSEEFIRRGHQVKSVYLYSTPSVGGLGLRKGDEVIGGREDNFSEKFPGFNVRIINGLRKILHDFQPEVVQANGGRTVKYAAVLGRIDSRRNWVLVYRNIGDVGVWLPGYFHKLFYRKIIGPCLDGIVAITSSSSRTLEILYKSSRNIIVIPNGVDPAGLMPAKSRSELRRTLLSPSVESVLIYVGSFTPEKRLDRLLRVFSIALKSIPRACLWLVGDGPLRQQVETQATELNLTPPHIHFFGYQTDISTFLNAADLLVLSSDTEGIPGVILEAAALGIPAVASRVGGLPDCIIDGQTGILFDPDNELQMAKAIVDLLKSSTDRIAMGKCAKEWIMQNFLMKNIADKYLNFYQEVVRRRNGAISASSEQNEERDVV